MVLNPHSYTAISVVCGLESTNLVMRSLRSRPIHPICGICRQDSQHLTAEILFP